MALGGEKCEKSLRIDTAVSMGILNSFQQSGGGELLDPSGLIDVKLFNGFANSVQG